MARTTDILKNYSNFAVKQKQQLINKRYILLLPIQKSALLHPSFFCRSFSCCNSIAITTIDLPSVYYVVVAAKCNGDHKTGVEKKKKLWALIPFLSLCFDWLFDEFISVSLILFNMQRDQSQAAHVSSFNLIPLMKIQMNDDTNYCWVSMERGRRTLCILSWSVDHTGRGFIYIYRGQFHGKLMTIMIITI